MMFETVGKVFTKGSKRVNDSEGMRLWSLNFQNMQNFN
jgi:hypothetical protein